MIGNHDHAYDDEDGVLNMDDMNPWPVLGLAAAVVIVGLGLVGVVAWACGVFG